MSTDAGIGASRRRLDGEAKVRGATRYAADLPVPGLLHARLVLAADAHARIASVERDAALQVPGVVAVLLADDLPTAAGVGGRNGEPLARREIVYSGQPVAIVVAESEAAAADGVEAVVVASEPLPAAVDLEAAMRPDAPRAVLQRQDAQGADVGAAHASVDGEAGETDDEPLSGNVIGRQRMVGGDAAAALAASDATVSGRFRTSWMHQAYLEPQAATAWLEPEGDLVVSTATQGAFTTRDQLAETFGLPVDRVRVRPTPLGGAFGGKLMIIEPLVAGATLVLRRPVRLALTRMEDFAATNPAPAELLELEIGATRDGRLTAIRGRVVLDRGVSDSFGLEGLSAQLAAGPYRWDAHDLTAYGVLTNRVGIGAYRAPGAPPAAFAIEALLDELAAALDLDPLELRLGNVLEEGDTGVDGRPFPVFGARACLERAREHPLWARRGGLGDAEGVGAAIGYWPGGLEPAAASCRLDRDGGLTVVTGAVDVSGTHTVFATIAAETLGVAPERVRIVAADTGTAPHAGISGGSKITYTVGRAIQRAAEEVRERLLEAAGRELEIAPEDLEIVGDAVRPIGTPSQALELAELAARAVGFGSRHEPIAGHGGVAHAARAPSAAAHLCHVCVDRETGRIEVLDHVVVQDVGRVLNRALVDGQMLGGTTQGLGWALSEELAYDDDGQLRAGSFAEYAIPSIDGVPPIATEVVEVPAPDGPFGAKGMAESSVVAVAPAVANAARAAVGVRLRDLPMTPLRVWSALREAR